MLQLPEYPWEQLAPYRELAAKHPHGVCDLSIGAPADPTPEFIQQALSQAANWSGYPTADGAVETRQTVAQWYGRRRNVPGLGVQNVTVSVGSKEFIAWLPTLLGLGPGDIVVRPTVAYPTYDIGATLCGATPIPCDDLTELAESQRQRVKLVWLNSPTNPTGEVADTQRLKTMVAQARELDAVIANDECYAELGWESWEQQPVPCILDPDVTGGDLTGLLSVYSLSKQSNMAGYRAAFAAGDPQLITGLINARKHAGMVVPGPIQAAMVAALNNDEHVSNQKDLYRRRRTQLKTALEAAGLKVEHSEAGLYLWVHDPTTPDTAEAGWNLVQRFAAQGIVVGPGVFYTQEPNGYVRVSMTATDQMVEQAAARIQADL